MSEIIELGGHVLKKLSELPKDPGIYKFLDKRREVLYIGKAKNLSNRTKSYFTKLNNRSKKLKTLIAESRFLEITLTSSELEALLLEQYSIKQYLPKFNVQFKDSKGYPWIVLETSKEYPAAKSYLGKKNESDLYFGPFPNSYASKEALKLIQKVFKLRDCTDSYFKNRSRPCMQYEIGRCSAPCVSAIEREDYLEEVNSAKLLLRGKGNDLINSFYSLMDKSAKRKLYERAASYRDKISSLREIQRSQSISGFNQDRDALYLCYLKGEIKIGVTSVRGGWIVKHENFIQENGLFDEEVWSTFLLRHYLFTDYCPEIILIEANMVNKLTIQKALSKKHNKKIRIISKPNKKDRGLLAICYKNTEFTTKERKQKETDLTDIFKNLSQELKLKKRIETIECYDISHHSSKNAIGVGIVFGKKGMLRNLYRTYNISKSNAGNDIASTVEVIERRFRGKSKKSLPKPDLLIIDGGFAHLEAVKRKIIELEIKGLEILSISKGLRRKPQMDSLHKESGKVINIKKNSKVHLLIQLLRNEAHRFAISKQRKKELKSINLSLIDGIEGVGKKRKTTLLRYFGSVNQISKANIQDLMKVEGIGKVTAQTIHKNLVKK